MIPLRITYRNYSHPPTKTSGDKAMVDCCASRQVERPNFGKACGDAFQSDSMCEAALPLKIRGGSRARAVLLFGRWSVELIDITAPSGPGSVMWPSQDAPSREFVSHTEWGDPSTVSRWTMSAHTGTHADSRMHFIPGGWTMESLKLSRCVGPCRLVDMTHVEGHVGRAD